MGNKKRRKKKTKNIKRTEVMKLSPGDFFQEREAYIEDINILIKESPNPSFVAQAIQIRDSFISGDRIFEFCSPIELWQEYMGLASFALERNGEVIQTLICRMN